MAEKMPKKTRQPKTTQPIAAEPVAEAPVAPAAPMRVGLNDLWEMRLAQAEMREAEAKVEAARFQRLYVLSKLDPKGLVLGVEKKMEDAKKAIEQAENRSLIAKKRMEHTLGRPLAGLAIDPDSGEVQQG